MAPSNTPDGAGRDDEAGLGHDGDRVEHPEDRSTDPQDGRRGDAHEDAHDAPRGGGRDRDGELEDTEVEAQWEDIVARLGELEAPAGAGRGDTGRGDPARDDAAHDPRVTPARRPTGPRDWPTTPEVEALEEAESHFTPPEPPPVLSSRDPLLVVAWAGAAGVPLLAVLALLVRAFVPLPTPAWLGGVGVAVFLASVGVLLWRMPQHRDPGDGPGAVV
jgi:hypothetical protein